MLIERRVIRDVEDERRRARLSQALLEQRLAWHGVKLNQPDWSPFSHSLAIGGRLKEEGLFVHIIFNAYWEPLEFELPILRDGREKWWRWVDTGLEPPNDIHQWNEETPVPGTTYCAGPRSVVVLIAATPGTSLRHVVR